MAPERLQQPRQLLRPVRAIGVHLDEDVVISLEPPAETSDVRGPEALLAIPVEHMDLRILGGEAIGKLASAVWTRIVHNQDVDRRDGGANPADDPLDVLSLVVRRDSNQHPIRHDASDVVLSCTCATGCTTLSGAAGAALRRPPAIASANATSPTPASSHSGTSPTRSASVYPPRSGAGATIRSRVNSFERSTIEPSGLISALIPLVAAMSIDRPCSTARSREIASCCSVCPVCP